MHLLSSNHLSIGSLRIHQEDLIDALALAHLAQHAYTVEDTFLRVFIDGHTDKLGLANADDRCHSEHCLWSDIYKISESFGAKEAERTSARRACAAFSSEVIWLKRETSLVKVEANTDAV